MNRDDFGKPKNYILVYFTNELTLSDIIKAQLFSLTTESCREG